MKRTLIIIVLVSVFMSSCRGSSRPRDFGKQWVRSNPFASMGMALTTKDVPEFNLPQYQKQNYPFLCAWRPRPALYEEASKTGYPWFLNLTSWEGATKEFDAQTEKIMAENPGCVGLYLNDEPTLYGRHMKNDKEVKFTNSFAIAVLSKIPSATSIADFLC